MLKSVNCFGYLDSFDKGFNYTKIKIIEDEIDNENYLIINIYDDPEIINYIMISLDNLIEFEIKTYFKNIEIYIHYYLDSMD